MHRVAFSGAGTEESHGPGRRESFQGVPGVHFDGRLAFVRMLRIHRRNDLGRACRRCRPGQDFHTAPIGHAGFEKQGVEGFALGRRKTLEKRAVDFQPTPQVVDFLWRRIDERLIGVNDYIDQHMPGPTRRILESVLVSGF